MTKSDLSREVVTILKERNIRKPVQKQKTVFHVSDDSGNSTDFVVSRDKSSLAFTKADIDEVINALLEVVGNAVRSGTPITIPSFGSLKLHKRSARATRSIETGEPIIIPERYTPKFFPGSGLKMAARSYGLSLEEQRLEAGD